MNKENSSIPENKLPLPSPAPSIMSSITEVVIRSLLDAAFRGMFLYFIWNLTLAQELHLPEVSYLFCACATLFTQILLSTPGESSILLQLFEINKKLTTLNNLTSLKMTMDVLSGDNITKAPESNKDSST